MYPIELLIMHKPNESAFGSQKRESFILPAVHEVDSSLTESTQKVRQGNNIK